MPGPHRQVQRPILPSEPTNPFPYVGGGSWAGITEDDWTEYHVDFLSKNPEFQRKNLDEAGRPMFGNMWDDVLIVKRGMSQRKRRPIDPPNFRDHLEAIVKKTGFVDQAVCLALGRFDEREMKEQQAFMHQLAFFILLREMLEEKQGNKIAMVFQDPAFNVPEEYVLSNLAGGQVVQHPEAVKYMTTSSFVFAPYIQNNVFASTVLLKRPVLYIGNRVESDYVHPMGQELARRYIRKAYMTGDHTFGPDMQEFVRQTDAFHAYYKKYVLDNEYDKARNLVAAFKNLWVHHPKDQHPRVMSSNASAFEFTAVKMVSTEPSIESFAIPADAMSSASDDTALSNNLEHLCVESDSTDNASKPIIESSQGESSGVTHPKVPESQPARPAVGLEGSIHAQSPINPALDPRNFPIRNKTDKLKGRWGTG